MSKNNHNSRYVLSVLLILAVIPARSQNADKPHYIKISGVTLERSGSVLPQTGIYSFKLQKGAASDSSGHFQVISAPGDTLLFSQPGYKPTLLIIPPEISSSDNTTEVYMIRDTLTIQEVLILPFRTYTEFLEATTKPKPLLPEEENMRSNIALVRKQLYFHPEATPGEGYRFAIQHIAYDAYTKGQLR